MWNRLWYVSIHQIGQCWRCSTLLPATWKVTSCTTQVYIHPLTWADSCNSICQGIKNYKRRNKFSYSQVVLGFINQCVMWHFKIFVANWVQQINDRTDKRQWHHVETSSKTADDNSEGVKSKHQEKIKSGLKFHHSYGAKNILGQKKCNIFRLIPANIQVNAVQVEVGVLVQLQRLTWNWSRRKRVMALLIKNKDICLKRIAKIGSINQLHDSIYFSALQEA